MAFLATEPSKLSDALRYTWFLPGILGAKC